MKKVRKAVFLVIWSLAFIGTFSFGTHQEAKAGTCVGTLGTSGPIIYCIGNPLNCTYICPDQQQIQ